MFNSIIPFQRQSALTDVLVYKHWAAGEGIFPPAYYSSFLNQRQRKKNRQAGRGREKGRQQGRDGKTVKNTDRTKSRETDLTESLNA